MKLPTPTNDTQDTLLALILNRSLTSIELRRMTKSSYPPARCFDLKKSGISIIATREKYVNRRGEVKSISRYTLANTLTEAKKIYKQLVKG